MKGTTAAQNDAVFKTGHLTKQDTWNGLKGVRIRGVTESLVDGHSKLVPAAGMLAELPYFFKKFGTSYYSAPLSRIGAKYLYLRQGDSQIFPIFVSVFGVEALNSSRVPIARALP